MHQTLEASWARPARARVVLLWFTTAAFRLYHGSQVCFGLSDKGLVSTLVLPCSAEAPAPLGSWAPGWGLWGWGRTVDEKQEPRQFVSLRVYRALTPTPSRAPLRVSRLTRAGMMDFSYYRGGDGPAGKFQTQQV